MSEDAANKRLSLYCQKTGCSAPSEWQVVVQIPPVGGPLTGSRWHDAFVGLVLCDAHRDPAFAAQFVALNREALEPVAKHLLLDLDGARTNWLKIQPRDTLIPRDAPGRLA